MDRASKPEIDRASSCTFLRMTAQGLLHPRQGVRVRPKKCTHTTQGQLILLQAVNRLIIGRQSGPLARQRRRSRPVILPAAVLNFPSKSCLRAFRLPDG